MNWDQIAGNWEQFKGRIQQEWGRLSDDDLQVAAGGRKRLEGLLREAYGYSEERAEQQLDEFLRRLEESGDSDSG